MSFRVQKSLGNSFFQFAVGRRREFRSIDNDPELSTGPAGEFIRHRPEIFYSADQLAIRSPELPPSRYNVSTPFWSSVYDRSPRGRMMLGLTIGGAIFLLWGLAVVANGARAGWVLVILGLLLAAVPVVTTAQKRIALRQQDERVRREREERDARNAELLSAYTTALERLREEPSDETLATVRRENEKLDLPYATWADTAIGTVLYVGFSTLARLGPERAKDVAQLMDRSSEAAGLIAADALAGKHALYSTVLWHLLADDRLGQEQLRIVRTIQEGFGIRNEDVPQDASAESQFDRLRGIDHRNAPRCEAQTPLKPNEYCMYSAEIRLADATADSPNPTIYITNKRVVLGGEKRNEIPVQSLDDVIVDVDASRVTIRAAELRRPLAFTAGEPIYLAAMIDLATRLDHRPKGFV